MKGSFLGPRFDEKFIENNLINLKAKFNKKPSDEISSYIAKELSNHKTVGWFQGRMEFGPRAS